MRKRGVGPYPRHTLRRHGPWLADTRVRLHLPRQLARDELQALYEHDPAPDDPGDVDTESVQH
jgi:hypothetical protein